jgi:gliding motility-associated-like protein
MVDATTIPGTIGNDTIVCKGGSGLIFQTAAGTGSIIKWQSRIKGATNWTDINNNSNTIYFFNLNDTTDFRAIYRNGLCLDSASNIVRASPRPLPTAIIAVQPATDTICAGEKATLTVTVFNVESGQNFSITYLEGSVQKTYNSSSNGYTAGPGAKDLTTGALTTTSNITLQSITTTDGIICASNLTNVGAATITVIDLPFATIVSGPDSICQGSSITFVVNISNVKSTNPWRLIYELEGDQDTMFGTGPGTFSHTDNDPNTATSAIISITEIVNLGTPHGCRSTNTDDWEIYIFKNTVAGKIEAADTICKGGNSVVKEVSGTIKEGNIIRWEYRPITATSWTTIVNTTTKLDVVNLNETTYYRAIYRSGNCDTAISNVIEIIVRELPVATISGSSTICSGDSTTLTINVSNVQAGQTWMITYLEGVTTRTLTGIGSGAFSLKVGNYMTSTDVTLTRIEITSGTPLCVNNALTNNAKATVVVNERPRASLNSVASPVCESTKSTFDVTVSNVRSSENWTLTYSVGATSGLTYSATGPGTYTITTPTLTPFGNYIVKLTGIKNNVTTCDTALTAQMTIVVDQTTNPGTIGNDTTVCKAANTGVITQTGGVGSVIRWEYSENNGATWTTINNTSKTYSYTNLSVTTLFRAVLKNGACSEATQSVPAKVTIREIPVATISGSTTICAGETASLTVTASNVYGESWMVSYLEGSTTKTLAVSGPLTTGTIVTSVLTTTTDVTLTKIWMTSGTPQCENNNLTNNATATVTVNQLPTASIVSAPSRVCTGDKATIKVSVSNVKTGETWKLYWSINGGTADSATGISAGSFDIVTDTLTANPSSVKLTSIVNTTTGCSRVLSDAVSVIVDPKTVGGTLTGVDTVCKGANSGTLVLGADAVGTVVRWEYSENGGATWTNINSTSTTYSYSNITKTTIYRVLVMSGVCAQQYSSTVTVVVNELPVATITGSKTICEGSSTTLSYTVSNVSSTQTWEITYLEGSTTKTITGTGSGTFTLTTGTITQTTDFTLQSIEITSGAPLCTNNSLVNNATATITTVDNPTATITNYPKNVCLGDNPSISVLIGKVKSTESWLLVYKVNSGSNQTTTGVGSGTFSFNIGVLGTVGSNTVTLVSITNTGSSPNCTSPLTESITINVDATSAGGTLSGPSIVCKNTGGTLTISGYTGSVEKWQSSVDGINFYDIANTSATLNFTNLTVKTWFRAVVKNGACAAAFSTVFIVDIQELPTMTISNPSQTICSGSSTTLSLTIGNVTSSDTWTLTYKENGTIKTLNGTGTSGTLPLGPLTTTTDVELVSISVTSGLKCSNTLTATATITVLENPMATIVSYPDSLCVGTTITFKVDVSNVRTADIWTLNFEINGVAAAAKTGTGPGVFTVTTSVAASVPSSTIKLTSIVVTNAPSCSKTLSDSAVIKVSPASVGGIVSSSANACYGANQGVLTLTGNVGAIQNWEYSTDGGSTWTVSGVKTQTYTYVNLTQTTTYRVFVKSGPCTGAYSSTVTITVIPLPQAIVFGSPRVCPNVGATFNITVSNVGATDNWTVNYTVNGGANQSTTGTGPGTKSITTAGLPYPNAIVVKLVSVVNTTYGCTNSGVVSQAEGKVTPNPVPNFTANNACADTIVVFNNTSTIAEGTITSYKWEFGDGSTSLDVSPTHSYSTPGTYSVKLTAISDNGCTAEITKTVTVFANPVANFTTANVCQNEGASFTDASTVSTGSINVREWNFGDGTTFTGSNPPPHRYVGAGTYLVTLTVTTNNGCQSSVTKSITIYTLPEANFVAQPVCQSAAMKFVNASAIGAGTMTYDWNFAGQGTSIAKDPSFTFSGFGTFNVTLIATSNFGCKDTIIRDVTVHPNPVASFTVNPACIGDESFFVNTSSVATGSVDQFYWNFGDTTFSGLRNPSHRYAYSGSFSVSLRVITNNGCEATTTVTADVLALPNVQLTANGRTSFCLGDSVTLSSANGNVRTYEWSWKGGSSTNPTIVAKVTGWYKLKITVPPIGCANEDSIFINVWPLPTVNAWPADKVNASRDTISKGESIQLHATGGVSYSWNPITYLDNAGIADPIAQVMMNTTEYNVTVTDINGCVNRDTVTIVVLDNFKLIVYNVVTPNGDGKNDTWIIENIWAYPNAEVSIFNRYGMEVFKAKPYLNTWDGTYNDKDLPDGAYYYVITNPDNKDIIYKGAINLIRNNK